MIAATIIRLKKLNLCFEESEHKQFKFEWIRQELAAFYKIIARFKGQGT